MSLSNTNLFLKRSFSVFYKCVNFGGSLIFRNLLVVGNHLSIKDHIKVKAFSRVSHLSVTLVAGLEHLR